MFLMILALISLAAVYKEDDPVADTQTNPIAYKDKMEEIKQGEKEAPKPSFNLIAKEKFMIDSNLEEEKPQDSSEKNQAPLGEDLPEDIKGQDQDQEFKSGLEETPKTEAENPEENGSEGIQEGVAESRQSQEEEKGAADDWWNTENTQGQQDENAASSDQNSFKN